MSVRRQWTHDHEGPLALFLVGLPTRQPWRPDRWVRRTLPAATGAVVLERRGRTARERLGGVAS